jgi:hypothetical protein
MNNSLANIALARTNTNPRALNRHYPRRVYAPKTLFINGLKSMAQVNIKEEIALWTCAFVFEGR